jgi:hypothetical protein
MPVIGIGAGLLGGLVKGLAGNKQKNEGKSILNQANQLGAFNEQVPSEITNAAATGLPSEQYNQAMQNIQQQQLQAIRGAHDRRGGLGSIAGIQQGTNNAQLGLDVKNAQARQANQFKLASWKDKVWQNNVKGKYNQQYNYGMGLLGAGNQNLVGGIDQAVGAVGAGAAGFFGNPSGLFGGGGNRSINNPGDFNSQGYATGVPGAYQNQQYPSGGGLIGG